MITTYSFGVIAQLQANGGGIAERIQAGTPAQLEYEDVLEKALSHSSTHLLLATTKYATK